MSREKGELRFRKLIDAAFLGELSPARWEELRAHLAGCADCRKVYDRATHMERALNGGVQAITRPSPGELARVEASVFARLDAEETSGARASGFADKLRAWLSAPRGFAAVAAAAAAVVAIAVLVPPREEGIDGELRARSAGTDARPASVRAFCVEPEGVSPLDEHSANTCALSAQLKLAVGNRGDHRYTFVVGLQADREPRWYVPRPPSMESARAPAPSDGEVPFGNAVKLDVNHEVGPLRIYAIFSDRPVRAAEVEAAIAELAREGRPPADAETLPLARKDVAQRSILVQVAP